MAKPGEHRLAPCYICFGGGRFCSNKCRTKDLAMSPWKYPQIQSRRGLGGKRADLGNIYFRSTWEANYARYLNWLIVLRQIESWEYEPDTFEFSGIKRGSRFYTPDFKVHAHDGSVEYHEVKGYMDDRSATKLRRMGRYHPSIKVLVIGKDCYVSIARQVRRIIPHWEQMNYPK